MPLIDATRRLVDAEFIGGMRRGALLVNAAGGPIADTDAITTALRAGRIRAALDVTDPAPLTAGGWWPTRSAGSRAASR